MTGNERRNKPLFKGADPINPYKLQVSEVLLQTCLPENEETRQKQNTLNDISLLQQTPPGDYLCLSEWSV